jgi:hypothetical protein
MISRTRKRSVELVETVLELIKKPLDSGEDFSGQFDLNDGRL